MYWKNKIFKLLSFPFSLLIHPFNLRFPSAPYPLQSRVHHRPGKNVLKREKIVENSIKFRNKIYFLHPKTYFDCAATIVEFGDSLSPPPLDHVLLSSASSPPYSGSTSWRWAANGCQRDYQTARPYSSTAAAASWATVQPSMAVDSNSTCPSVAQTDPHNHRCLASRATPRQCPSSCTRHCASSASPVSVWACMSWPSTWSHSPALPFASRTASASPPSASAS